jgi:predicted transposase YdaD
MFYNARLKFQRDEEARVLKAREDGLREGEARGRQEGRQEGVFVGRILLLQQLLGIPESVLEELSQQNASELANLEVELQRQLRARGQ